MNESEKLIEQGCTFLAESRCSLPEICMLILYFSVETYRFGLLYMYIKKK